MIRLLYNTLRRYFVTHKRRCLAPLDPRFVAAVKANTRLDAMSEERRLPLVTARTIEFWTR